MRKVLMALLPCCLVAACSNAVYFEPPRSNPAAGLSAPNQFGKTVSLKEACSGPWAAVFFYPEADTPG